MNERKTEWYSGAMLPVRSGVYERQFPEFDFPLFSYYDATNHRWGADAASKFGAEKASRFGYHSGYQNLPWRGIHLRRDPRKDKQERRK